MSRTDEKGVLTRGWWVGKGPMVTLGYSSGVVLRLPGRGLLKKQSGHIIVTSLDSFCCCNLLLVVQRGLVTVGDLGLHGSAAGPRWIAAVGHWIEVF